MTNTKHLFPFVFLIFLAGSNSALGQRIGSEEYRIYSIVLKDIDSMNRKSGSSNNSYLVILDRTEFDNQYSSGTESARLYKSLEKRNITPTPIEKQLGSFGYRKNYHLALRKEVESLLEKSQKEFDAVQAAAKIKTAGPCNSSWKYFYERYPDASGYQTLSRVGFSRGLAVVMVKQESVCGFFSMTYILKRSRGRWRIYSSYGSGGVA